MPEQPLDPTEAFAALGRIKLSDTDLNGVLRQIAELARRAIPGATDVSVTLVRHTDAYTAAFTSDLALSLDEWQYDMGRGPCLDAAEGGAVVSVPETGTEERWAAWAARASAAGVGSSLSIGLPIQDAVVGALNIYSTKPEAFDDDGAFAVLVKVSQDTNRKLRDVAATLVDQAARPRDN